MKLFNTTTNQKEDFRPHDKDKVTMYSCGPTVYGAPHIGNMRAYLHVDLLKTVLEKAGYEVVNVINITDVGHLTSDDDEGDDKLEMQAAKENKRSFEIADFYTSKFLEYLDILGITLPTYMPKATDYIKEQINIIKELEQKGYTYTTSDGVYFDSSLVNNYAQIAKIDMKGLIAGYRVPIGEKRNATDFALWKFSPIDKQRDMEWESPWGLGFPGWHIECSAMAMSLLGESIDIHTGGIDHIHVHHASEIAQSEAFSGKTFARFWSHVNFLQTDEKMSKSKGNVVTLDTIQKNGFSGMHMRYFYLLAHYKNILQFDLDFKNLQAAKNAYESLKNRALELKRKRVEAIPQNEINDKFIALMEDDLNTPEALAYIFKILKGDEKDEEKLSLLLLAEEYLKLDIFKEPEVNIPEEVVELANKRVQSRLNRNWKEADYYREEINSLGYSIKDTKEGYAIEKY